MRILNSISIWMACTCLLLLAHPVFGQDQTFLPVAGSSLTTRMDSAVQQGQARRPQTRFWTAYAFDVRPGVAVDVQMVNTDGTTNTFGIMIGGGFETRSLGVFLLREPETGGIIRIEVFNLNRRRNYSGYPVYWLDHANPEESVAYLSSITESSLSSSLIERTIMALALHDEPGALSALERVIRTSSRPRTRTAAVSWLGHLEGDPAFFADLVRREDEILDVRKRAVSAIANRKDRTSFTTLQNLYETVKHRDIKKRLISDIAGNGYDEEANVFLMDIARDTGEDYEIRKQAISRLSHTGGNASYQALFSLYDQEQNMELKSRIISVLASTDAPRVRQKMIDIARTEDHPQLRKKAVRELAQRGDSQMIPTLIGLYDTEQYEDVRTEILNALGESHHADATKKLIAVARSQTSKKLRQRATYWLGKSNDPQAVQFFESMFKE